LMEVLSLCILYFDAVNAKKSGYVRVRVGEVAISTTCINAKRMGRWRLSDTSEHIWRLFTNAVIAISNVAAEHLCVNKCTNGQVWE
jgi:hypothetical protein